MILKPRTLVLGALFLVLAASCAPKAPTEGLGEMTAGEAASKAALLNSSVKSVKGLARVSISAPGEKISYTQVTVASEPDRIRLEALNPFGSTVGFISSDGGKIYIISSSARETYDGGEEFNLADIYPGLDLTVTAESLTNLVLGRLPYNVFSSGRTPGMSTDGRLLKLTYPGSPGGGEDAVWLDPSTFKARKAEFSLEGGRKATVSYEYFDGLIAGHYFARRIEFESKGLSITLVYEDDVEVNVPVDSSLFRPAASAGTIENMRAQNYN